MILIRRRGQETATDSPDAAPSVQQVPVPTTAFRRAFSSLALPQFRTLWLGMFFSVGAMQIEIVARSWLAFDLTGSAFLLGLVAMARGIPQAVLSPIAGVAADRYDRRKLLLYSQTSLMGLALVNAVLVHLGVIEIWHLFVIGLLQGVAFPFTMPTRTAFLSVLVGRDQMANALALDSTGRNLNMIAAPAIAGVLIAVNATLAFYTIALFYGLAVLTLFRLPSGSHGDATKGNTFEQMLYGFRYIFGNRTLAMYILLSIVPILLGMPFQQLLPVFQEEVLEVGPEALGLMFTMVGIGALLGSLGAAYFSDSSRMGIAQIVGGVAFGASLTAFALSPFYLFSLAMLLIVGLSSQTYMTINRSLLMLNSDQRLYGRVMSVYVMQWYLMPVALVPLGAVADRVGVSLTVGVMGLVIAAFIGAVAARNPTFFRRTPEEPSTAASSQPA